MEGRWAFLDWFEGILVSGREKLRKPDPRIFRLLFERHGLAAHETVFVDDNLENVQSARALGMQTLLFTSADTLESQLRRLLT